MPNEATALEYERLAAVELEAASAAGNSDARNAHLNQAGVYAHLSEKARRDTP